MQLKAEVVQLPSLGIGCAALSILSPDTGDEAAVEMLVGAYDSGVRYFDVAPLYGGGRGEVLLGTALAHFKQPVMVSTKVGYVGEIPYGGRLAHQDRQKNFSRAAIEQSVTTSLRRLKRDAIDVVFLHDPIADLDGLSKEALPALEDLLAQGLIRGIGVGTTNVAAANAILDRFAVSVMLLAGRFTLIDRSGEKVLERCRLKGVQLVVGGVFNSGLLAADQPSAGANFDYAPAPLEMIRRADAAQRLCLAAGIPLKAAAAQFARRHPAVTTTLLGPRTLHEFNELIALLALPITPSLWEDLDRRDLWTLSQ